MRLKRIGLGLLIITVVGTVFGWKVWQQQGASITLSPTYVQGPTVILFRGDNSSGCRTIHRLVDEAAALHDKQVNFVQLDWSEDNPLIEHYQVRFLPTVVFIDQHNQEVGRLIGESATVQRDLKQALTQLDALLGQ